MADVLHVGPDEPVHPGGLLRRLAEFVGEALRLVVERLAIVFHLGGPDVAARRQDMAAGRTVPGRTVPTIFRFRGGGGRSGEPPAGATDRRDDGRRERTNGARARCLPFRETGGVLARIIPVRLAR